MPICLWSIMRRKGGLQVTGSTLPPWRQSASMMSKWRPRRSEDVVITPNSPLSTTAYKRLPEFKAGKIIVPKLVPPATLRLTRVGKPSARRFQNRRCGNLFSERQYDLYSVSFVFLLPHGRKQIWSSDSFYSLSHAGISPAESTLHL